MFAGISTELYFIQTKMNKPDIITLKQCLYNPIQIFISNIYIQ